MISAWLTGCLGAALTYWVGSRYCAFSLIDCAWALAATNASGFFGLLLTLALERRPAIRRVLMGNAFKTWLVLWLLYTSGLVALDPALRVPRTLAIMWAPLVFGVGFMLPFWGWVQDRVIRFEHRRKKQEFARPVRDAIREES